MRARPRLPDDGVNLPKTHPLRELLLVGGAVTLAGIVILTALAFSVELLAPLVPLEAEAALLEGLSPQLDAVLSPEHGAEARALEALVARLAGHWPENPYSFRVGVLPDDEVNAFAVPGGMIVVTRGLLTRVRSENELAFVLAHELGHFRNRDHIETLGRSLVFSMALGFVGIDTTDLSLFGASGMLTSRTFGRDAERDADRFGLEIVVLEYGHAGGATDFLEGLQEGGAWTQLAANFLGTHPFGPDRADDLQQLAASQGWPTEGALRPLDLAGE